MTRIMNLTRLQAHGRLYNLMSPNPVALCIILLWFSGTVWAAPAMEVEQIITGLANPVAITHAGDGSGRLFITLQGGQVIIYDGSQVLPTPFLDINSLVSTGFEQGLLSVAFHPDYKNNGLFFVNYTNTSGNTVIARYSVSANPNLAAPGSATILLTISQPFGNHNGGQLQFGPDGYLYIVAVLDLEQDRSVECGRQQLGEYVCGSGLTATFI